MTKFPWEKDPNVKTEREGLAHVMDHRSGTIHSAKTPKEAALEAARSDQARGQGHHHMALA